jgi:hypothetical protein
MRTDKDFNETKEQYELRVKRIQAQNKKELDFGLHIEVPEINCNTSMKPPSLMRTVRELLAKHKSFYAAFKSLGLRQSGQFKRWSDLDAKVDDDGQVWIKTGKPIEGWKR